MSAARRRKKVRTLFERRVDEACAAMSRHMERDFFTPNPVWRLLREYGMSPRDQYRELRSTVRRCIRILALGQADPRRRPQKGPWGKRRVRRMVGLARLL